uniref:Solute carrier family 26 member 2 n=1 Tax=Lates calcarifer TaxID=8187 RepID=A0A4W6C630_LATCA
GFAITVSLSEMFAKKHGYKVDANQEMYAIGFCNILPSFFRCFTTSAALTKTLVKESTGMPDSDLTRCFKCVLAVIIVVNLRGALRKFTDIPRMWRINHVDTSIWLVTMLTSSLVNTELGLLVGVLVSAFCVLGRTQQVQVLELGRATTREHYEDLSSYRGLQTHPGVAVFRYEAPLYYANQSMFKKSLYKCVGLDPVKEKTRRLKIKKKKSKQQEGVADATNMKSEKEDEATATVTLMPDEKSSLRSIVIDCSRRFVRKDYGELGVKVVLAQCNTSVLDTLERGGYYPDKKGSDGGESRIVFFTIADAVRYVQSLSAPNGDCDTKH